MSRSTLVIGIDGGGSKTTALIADEQGHALAQIQGKATNPHVVGFDTAAVTLSQLIQGLCSDVRCDPAEIRSVVAGVAGVGREADRKRLREDLAGILEPDGIRLHTVGIETDARIALEAAFGGASGVILIAGTGSIVMGKTARGDIVSVGGWGRILGDEGGGYFIGREALMAVVQELDGRGSAGRLREFISRQLKWETRDQIIAAVYQDRTDLARLAPIVIEAAAANDLVAQRILQRAATLLVEQARVVVMQMGILKKVGLVMLGGLAAQDSLYANVLHLKIFKLLPQVDVRAPIHPPANGAVQMALERLKKS
jgi:N-acetylglucosamine kinase-like BadF-type ATPase